MGDVLNKKLNKAPIVEALIDFSVLPTPNNTFEKLKTLTQKLKFEFPKVEELRSAHIQFARDNIGHPTVTQLPPMGFKLTSKNATEILQIRTNGFTFSRLAPYETWDKFSSQFKKLWELYSKETQVTVVNRIGIRVINNLNLPVPLQELKNYLNAFPVVPAGLPQTLNDYLMRTVIPLDDIKGTAIIAQVLGRGPHKAALPLILDIDVFVQGNYKVAEKDLWEIIEKMRFHKNDIFFKTITPKAEALYT